VTAFIAPPYPPVGEKWFGSDRCCRPRPEPLALARGGPEEHIQEAAAFDPESFERRCELLDVGENLLAYDRIHEMLGTSPRSARRLVDGPDVRWAWRHHPLVSVPK
jgi:hypothetical protein